ncbi:AAA domain-containing protein [Tenacibaculum dicentrarchi]|nr:AAA domain-containing protein [Tenacibaculum dicentrarchi]
MKIEDIFQGKKEEIKLNLKPSIKGEKFTLKDNTSIIISFSQDVYWLVYDNNDRIEVKGITPKDDKELDRITTNKSINLLITAKHNKAEIKVKLLDNIINLTEGIEIGLTDIIISDIDKRYSRKRGRKKHIDWLTEELIIEKKYVLIDNLNDLSGFRIYGKSIAINVKKNEDEKYEITTILKKKNYFNPTSLIKGKIEIKDISEAGKLRADTELQINKINANQRYIKTWEKYQEKEKESTLKEVNKFGFLRINEIVKKSENKYELVFESDENTDNWLKIKAKSHIVLNKKQEHPDFYSSEKSLQDFIIVELIKKEKTFLFIKCDDKIDIKNDSLYYASLSPLGNAIVSKRRMKALEEIRNTATPMPVLAAVLEGVDYNSVIGRKIKPLTSKVKKEFGEFGPNPMQEHALDVALNSPDITIIQGPPGTGKTKVITALAKRLTEVYKENGEAPEMNILLTAFQHDAVENMASRTEVLGLPAIKFGKIQNQSVDIIEKWIYKQTEKTEAIQNGIEPNEYELIYNDIFACYLSYIETQDDEKAKNDLVKIRKNNIAILPDEILNEISSLTKKELTVNDDIKSKIKDLITNIRTNQISYEDDGAINLKRYLTNYSRYKDELPEVNLDVIKKLKIILETKDISKIDYEKLSDIRVKLLNDITSIDLNKTIKLSNAKIESCFKQLIDFYTNELKSDGSIYSVLTEFQDDLNSNKERVKETVQNYVAIMAATVQGSKAKDLTEIKPDPFDTVIVDEAARANPLDLLIPLTSAKRRIVLVGDHRQLPHIIDTNIQKELQADEDAAEKIEEHLKDSLFERFYNNLKKLHKKDGIIRVVTLNTQYRMHPIIGDFISRTFYEKYGDPKIKSGTPAEKLIHNIPEYKNKVAVSINIPIIKGEEQKENGSTFRIVEAQETIRRAKEILDSDPSISVGVITFYSRQVEELFSEAKKVGMAEKNEDNTDTIAKAYQKTMKGEERFRIGSVDAFQGKEFYIVILSLVRSNKIDIKNIQGKYGFLTSYNRLNVAMSRAKKLLIAVGDKKMFTTKEAEQHVYGLYAFYNELINSKDGLSI